MAVSDHDEGKAPQRAQRSPSEDFSAPGQAQHSQHLNKLQNEMLTAVRGAITGVMAKGAPTTEMPDLDLDFSLPVPHRVNALPMLRAEPERSLTLPDLQPSSRNRKFTWMAVAAGLAAAGATAGLTHWPQIIPFKDSNPSLEVTGTPAAPAKLTVPVEVTTLPATAKPPAPPLPQTRDAVDTANELIQQGHLAEARRTLLSAPPPERSAVALLLARSYDPNFLQTLTKSDASADPDQARHWYRRWYELGVKEGAVPQSMRLDLLLRSLENTKSR